MAQRLVSALLQRTLDAHTEGGVDLEAQVLRGRICLARTVLKPVALPRGLEAVATVEQLALTWSWRSLLSAPVTLEATGVSVVLKSSPAREQPAPTEAPTPSDLDASSCNFLHRLLHRIWDGLRVEVRSVHVRLEEEEVAGAVIDCLCLSGDSDEQGAKIQVGSCEGLGVYLQPPEEAGAGCPPDASDSSFVAQGLSMRLRATRRFGRAFVDWRGLEVETDLCSPRLSWSAAHKRSLSRLLRRFQPTGAGAFCSGGAVSSSAVAFGGDAIGSEAVDREGSFLDVEEVRGEDDSFFDCEEAPGKPARPEWLPPEPQPAPRLWRRAVAPAVRLLDRARQLRGSALPTDLSTEDRKLLMEEAAAPPRAAVFRLAVAVSDASLLLADGLLQAAAAGRCCLLFTADGWRAEWRLENLEVSDLAKARDGEEPPRICRHGVQVPVQMPSAAALEAPHTLSEGLEPERTEFLDADDPEQTPSSTSVIAEGGGDTGEMTELTVRIAPTELRLSQTLLRAWQSLGGDADSEPAPGRASPVPTPTDEQPQPETPWLLQWQAGPLSLVLAEPWLPGAKCACRFSSGGSAGSDGRLSGSLLASLHMTAAAGDSATLLEGCSVLLDRPRSRCPVALHCKDLTAACSLREAAALARGISGCLGELGSLVPAQDRARGSGETAAQLLMQSFSLAIALGEGQEVKVTGRQLSAHVAGGSWVAALDRAELAAGKAGEEARGLLRLDCVSLSLGAKTEERWRCEVELALELHDLSEEHVALSCPSVHLRGALAPSAEPIAVEAYLSLATVHLDSTEAFVNACRQGAKLLYNEFCDVTTVTCELSEHPLGLTIEDGVITEVSGAAEGSGIAAGSVLCALEPPQPDVEVELAVYLSDCPLPLTVVFWPPYPQLHVDISVAAFALLASRFSAASMDMEVEKAEVSFEAFERRSWRGTSPELLGEMATFFEAQAKTQLPWIIAACSLSGQNLGTYTAGFIGCSLAVLRYGGAKAGAVGHVLATSAAALPGLHSASLARGKELRGAQPNEEAYLADATSGLLDLAAARGRAVRSALTEAEEEDGVASGILEEEANLSDATLGSVVGVADFVYQERLVSSTVGAVVGGMIGEVAGPVGALAGATAGATAGAQLSRLAGSVGTQLAASVEATVAVGRESRGEAEGSYQFGDFSRGLWSLGWGTSTASDAAAETEPEAAAEGAEEEEAPAAEGAALPEAAPPAEEEAAQSSSYFSWSWLPGVVSGGGLAAVAEPPADDAPAEAAAEAREDAAGSEAGSQAGCEGAGEEPPAERTFTV